MTTYADYQRDRIGWFFGLSGGQLMFLALASLPAFWAISRGAWFSALLFAMVWLFALAITVIPVRGRSATGWVFASTMYAVGGLLGWTSFRAKASQGRAEDLDTPDLPGVLQGIQIHDGPPHGSQLQRVAIIAGPRHQDLGGHRRDRPPGHRHEGHRGAHPLRRGARRADRRRRPHREGRRDPLHGAHRPRGRRRAGAVGQQAPAPRRPAAVRARQQRPRPRTDPGLGPHRDVRDHRRSRDPDRPVGQGVRRRPRGPVPGALPAHGRDRGPAARAHGDDLGAVADQPRTRTGVPDRVRSGRPGRHRRGAGDAGEGRRSQRRRPLGDGRTLGRRCHGAALQPRRVELDQRHHQAAQPRRGDGGAGADPHPERVRGAALVPGRLPDRVAVQGGPAVRQRRVGSRPGRRR